MNIIELFKTPEDKLGNTLQVGDYIVYGHLLSRSAALRVGQILKIVESAPSEYFLDANDSIIHDQVYDVNLRAYVKNTVLPATKIIEHDYRITVIGINNDSNRHYWNTKREPEIAYGKGTLQFPERTLKLTDSQITQQMRDLLEEITDKTDIKALIKDRRSV